MTRKDFALIAGVLAAELELVETNGFQRDLHDLAEAFADVLTETHPNFDRDRFLATAGGES